MLLGNGARLNWQLIGHLVFPHRRDGVPTVNNVSKGLTFDTAIKISWRWDYISTDRNYWSLSRSLSPFYLWQNFKWNCQSALSCDGVLIFIYLIVMSKSSQMSMFHSTDPTCEKHPNERTQTNMKRHVCYVWVSQTAYTGTLGRRVCGWRDTITRGSRESGETSIKVCINNIIKFSPFPDVVKI